MNPVNGVRTERGLPLHAECDGSEGEAPISRIDDFSRISLRSEVFFCHREHQVLACRDQPKIGSIALLNETGIGGFFEEFRTPLFRPASCYQVSEPPLFLFVQLRGPCYPMLYLANVLLILFGRRLFLCC